MAPSSSSSSSSSATSVQVALRIRPATAQDAISIPARFQRTVIHAASPTSVAVDATTSTPSSSGAVAAAPSTSSAANAKKQHFTFDQVHPQETTQHALFTSTAEPLLHRFLEGFNCTILAYGQTSSGKTFTMTGIDLDADPSDPSTGMGIIPRAVSTIFKRARSLKEERGNTWNFSIKGSFIEIYNEDLIDLLSDDGSGNRGEVHIREGKDGQIIWGGLREIPVKNAGEVMHLIRQGTSIRRTNETDMNAQSSRSHAIFSLTLTQRKFTGGGAPPRSTSPLPAGRSPSRLARPGSMFAGPAGGRVSSPTMGRPGTPSFSSAIGRGGLRPASSLGLHAESRASTEEEGGEWVTVVSKFHFVDLAGSERLKRTAAAGDRIKEGISINSGLLALGNVISALGDPARAKSHTASYVPYRDSKLTRLLQDSLGGNAHTLMIACVSPAEWNTAETVNTLKYANRARNIKNRAIINEKEEGWDDVEWLQGMVTRLRKDLKVVKEGGAIPPSDVEIREPVEGASKKMLANYNDLKNNYEELREKYVARNEELNRLRKEHGESHRSSTTGTVPGMSKYEEIVGPVIEEYEKTISAMEAELSLNRAALRHTNELVEEKEEELAQVTERKAATELYVEELRARLVKVTERESSTEAYVRDLEEKMKQYDESSVSSSESMSDLRRELSRFKESETQSSKYIADLEARLARADESVLSLRQNVEKLEQECDRRRGEIEVLQDRLDSFKKDGEAWRSDLEDREHRVLELELKMEEWQAKKQEAADARARLGSVASEVELEHKKLATDIANVNGSSTSLPSGAVTPKEPDLNLENQLVTLQQTHTATLADLSSVTSKYRDALREISDLAAQIQEAKLSNVAPSETTDRSVDLGSPRRRRMTGGRHREGSDAQLNGTYRRPFFRQAASAESLHSRSLSQSLSLSQELSSARSRKTSFSSHGTSSPTNSPSHRPNLSISLPALAVSPHERSVSSLEKEIMRLQDVLKEREQEIAHLETSLKEKESVTPVTPLSAPTSLDEAGSVANGDGNPVTFLSPKTLHQFDEIKSSLQYGHERTDSQSNSDTDEPLDRLNELMRAMAQKESQHRETVETLNEELVQLRRQHDELTALSRDQTVNMCNELESLRSKHEADLSRLEELERREAELEKTIEQLEVDHSRAMEGLRAEHAAALDQKAKDADNESLHLKQDFESSLALLRDQLADAIVARERSSVEHSEASSRLTAEHKQELLRRQEDENAALSKLREEHEAIVRDAMAKHKDDLKQQDEEHTALLAKTEEEYYNGLTKLRTEHARVLEQQAAQSAAALERLREDHVAELQVAEVAREGTLSESHAAQSAYIKEIQEKHATAIAKKEATFAEETEHLKTEHARVLTSAMEDHDLSIRKLRFDHSAAISKVQEESTREIEQLRSSLTKAREDHDAALSKARQESEASLQALKEQQAEIFKAVEASHQEEITSLTAAHQAALNDATSRAERERTNLQQSHTKQVDQLRVDHEKAAVELAVTFDARMKSALKDSSSEAEQDRAALSQAHADEITALQRTHEMALTELQDTIAAKEVEHAKELALAIQRNDEVVDAEKQRLATQLAAARSEHEKSLEELNAALVTEQQDHLQALEAARLHNDERLKAEKERVSGLVAELEEAFTQERTTLAKDHDILVNELASYKAAVEEHALAREQARLAHEQALSKHSDIITSLHQDLSEAHNEREELAHQVETLKAQLNDTHAQQTELIQEASKRDSLVDELEKHRSVLAEMQNTLQRVKDEKDAIQEEKARQENYVRDLQAQLARVPSPELPSPVRAPSSYSRVNGLSSGKLPPPTPPPTVPPPPAPRMHSVSSERGFSTVSSSNPLSPSSSRDSELDSPATSVTPSVTPVASDRKVQQQLEEQAKAIDEQEAMIKTLNKQLTHCESDLQAHMDLVNTLETSLGDSEKNLRKARMQATEIARERDTLNSQIEGLRSELQETKREVATVRKSVVEEKQSLEHRLDEERRAKERVRQQLDSRMDELQKRKSKFVCL